MKQTLTTLTKQLQHQLPSLRRKFNVAEIGIFGSVAKRRDISTSDVDVLVTFSRPPGLFKFVRLEEHLSHTLHRKVDLVTKKALKPAIKQKVLREVRYV